MKNKISQASVEELMNGYLVSGEACECLFCGKRYINGYVYETENGLAQAAKAAELHVRSAHGSVFEALLSGDKKQHGLSEVQSELMSLFYRGIPDKEIAELTQTSPSTVRFQRFNLREKARQAKVFLALFALMEAETKGAELPDIHPGATMVDERYMTTSAEAEKIIRTYFSSLDPLILKSFPPKEKKKLVLLKRIAGQFEVGKTYSEKEVNTVLRAIYSDFATVRRYLIEYGFMERTPDCSEYRLKDEEHKNG